MENEQQTLLNCPFCGETGLGFTEGDTHRWMYASCDGCGVMIEVRKADYALKADDPINQKAAIIEWNTRAASPNPALRTALERIDKMLCDASDDDAFTRNHSDGANLSGLPVRDVYELGRSTLLLNLMGRFAALKGYLAEAIAAPPSPDPVREAATALVERISREMTADMEKAKAIGLDLSQFYDPLSPPIYEPEFTALKTALEAK